MGAVTTTFRVESDDAVPVPVDDVLVRVFDTFNVFVTEGLTGTFVTGEVQLTLIGSAPGTGYVVRLAKAGWSFGGEPTFPVSVYDPPGAPPNDNIFEFVAHEGMTGQLTTFVVKDDALVPAPIEDVRIRVFDNTDVFATEGDTDVVGELELVLIGAVTPGLNYYVRLYKPGIVFEDGSTQIVQVIDPLAVGQTNIFEFTGHAETVPESDDPDMCLMTGHFTDASLHPLSNLILTFTPRDEYPPAMISGVPFTSEPTLVRNRIIAAEIRVRTDPSGYISVALPRNGVFDVRVHGLDQIIPEFMINSVVVPDRAGAEIKDVLFPYITSVVYSTGSVSLAVGETEDVEVTLTTSNQQTVAGKAQLDAFLVFATDETVATVEVSAEGKLTIKGIATGTTSVTVTRAPGTYPSSRPELADIVATPIGITVV